MTLLVLTNTYLHPLYFLTFLVSVLNLKRVQETFSFS